MEGRINHSWSSVKLRRIDKSGNALTAGESLKLGVAANLGELSATDVILECLIGTESAHEEFIVHNKVKFESSGVNKDGEDLFELDLEPPLTGLQFYKLRLYPNHPLLSHPFETGRIIWL